MRFKLFGAKAEDILKTTNKRLKVRCSLISDQKENCIRALLYIDANLRNTANPFCFTKQRQSEPKNRALAFGWFENINKNQAALIFLRLVSVKLEVLNFITQIENIFFQLLIRATSSSENIFLFVALFNCLGFLPPEHILSTAEKILRS